MRNRTAIVSSIMLFITLFTLSYPKTIGTNLVIITISILTYMFLKNRYSKDWDNEHHVDAKSVAQLNLIYRQNKQRCNICGRWEINRVRFTGRFCSISCEWISSTTGFYLILVSLAILTLFNPRVLIFTFVLYLISVYLMEIDTHQRRYAYNVRELNGTFDGHQHSFRAEINKTPLTGQSKFITELNESFKNCCYQTARLQEKYCLCGKPVPQKLMRYLEQ